MPPVFAFQSRVDATVKTDKLLEMFEQIAPRESEILLFDVNHQFDIGENESILI